MTLKKLRYLLFAAICGLFVYARIEEFWDDPFSFSGLFYIGALLIMIGGIVYSDLMLKSASALMGESGRGTSGGLSSEFPSLMFLVDAGWPGNYWRGGLTVYRGFGDMPFLNKVDDGHAVLIMPSGVGKSRGICMPTIVGWRDSGIVIDMKGELAENTIPHRIARGASVAVWDPFQVTDFDGIGIDLIASIRNDTNLQSDAAATATALCGDGESKDGEHWHQTSIQLLTAILMLARLNDWDMHKLLQHWFSQKNDLLKLMLKTDALPFVQGQAAVHINRPDGERGSIDSTLTRCLTPIYDQVIPHTGSTFTDLLRNDIMIYLVLPPDKLQPYSGMLRALVTAAANSCIAMGVKKNGEKEILFLIDECATLGNFSFLKTAPALLRGYGVRLMQAWQNIAQIKDNFGAGAETITSNATVIYYGSVRDVETAEYISKSIGDVSIRMPSENKISITRADEAKKMPAEYRVTPALPVHEVMNMKNWLIRYKGAFYEARPSDISSLPPWVAVPDYRGQYQFIIRRGQIGDRLIISGFFCCALAVFGGIFL